MTELRFLETLIQSLPSGGKITIEGQPGGYRLTLSNAQLYEGKTLRQLLQDAAFEIATEHLSV